MKSLRNSRLIQLYDAYDDGKKEICLLLELIEGGELFERVIDDDFVLTERACAIFMRQICEGIQFIHLQHVLHLDMKVTFNVHLAIFSNFNSISSTFQTAGEYFMPHANWKSDQINRFRFGTTIRSVQETASPFRYSRICGSRSGQFRNDRLRDGSLVGRHHLLRLVSYLFIYRNSFLEFVVVAGRRSRAVVGTSHHFPLSKKEGGGVCCCETFWRIYSKLEYQRGTIYYAAKRKY